MQGTPVRAFLRTVPDDLSQMQAIMSVMLTLNWTLVIPIFTDDAYGVSGHSYFVEQATRHKIKTDCLSVIPYSDKETGDPETIKAIENSSMAHCIAASPANVVLLYSKWAPSRKTPG